MPPRNDAKAVWNDKGCKKGMIAIEKGWADIGNGEPFSMAAIAKIFRTEAGEPPDKLDLKEIGEFLAGGDPPPLPSRRAHPASKAHAAASLQCCHVGAAPSGQRGAVGHAFRAACSVPLAHHSGLNAGKPQMAVCRNEFIDTFDFVNNTFVQAMRAFLGCVRDS
jgi:hypothetical protein